MRVKRLAELVLGLALLGVWWLANDWAARRWLGSSYAAWYLANGSQLNLLGTLATLAWGELNRHTGLISANPRDFVGSYLQLAGLPIYEMGRHLRSDAAPRHSRTALDTIAAGIMCAAVSLGIVAWVVVVTPAQYLVYLVCGAPGRVFSTSTRRVTARFAGGRLELRDTHHGEDLAEGWWEAGMASKPVSLTSALAALLIAAVRILA